MIPILLQAHTRSITKVLYNHEGDLLFSASKDGTPNLWRSANGERLGSYNGHEGAVWSLDVTKDSTRLVSGSADNSVKTWDVCTGKLLATHETDTGVRSVEWAQGLDTPLLAVVTDATMGFKSSILVLDSRVGKVINKIMPDPQKMGKAMIAKWTDCNKMLLTGHIDGHLALWNPESKATEGSHAPIHLKHVHSEAIRDIQYSQDKTYFITASKDTTAQLVETSNLHHIKTYKTDRPVNSASISPIRAEVVLAGGQEALNVTTTSSRAGQFEARFFHQIWNECELGRVGGHFGPINTLSYHPRGIGYASGAEDGFIRVHKFDPDYFEFSMVGEGMEEPLL